MLIAFVVELFIYKYLKSQNSKAKEIDTCFSLPILLKKNNYF